MRLSNSFEKRKIKKEFKEDEINFRNSGLKDNSEGSFVNKSRIDETKQYEKQEKVINKKKPKETSNYNGFLCFACFFLLLGCLFYFIYDGFWEEEKKEIHEIKEEWRNYN